MYIRRESTAFTAPIFMKLSNFQQRWLHKSIFCLISLESDIKVKHTNRNSLTPLSKAQISTKFTITQ